MRLRPFAYHRPDTLAGALAALDQHGDDATPFAGGTELLLVMKLRLADYAHLVDLKRIPELRAVAEDDDGLHIGAMSTHRAIALDRNILRTAPALAALCGKIANPRVRSLGTLGGNLCFAEPNADPPVLLAAYGATLRLASVRGARAAPAESFIKAPLETERAPDEILTRVDLPAGRGTLRYARHMNGHRSLACAAAFVPAGPGEPARIWLGGIGQRPMELRGAEAALAASSDEIELGALRSIVMDEVGAMDVLDDAEASTDYRRHIGAVMSMRAIEAALVTAGRGIRP